jgi:hypothetical protein
VDEMSAFWGYVWLSICIIFAGALWALNVVFVDNAIPTILDPIQNAFTTPIVDMSNGVTTLLVMIRWSPLLLIFIGVIGWILECTLWGKSEQHMQGDHQN